MEKILYDKKDKEEISLKNTKAEILEALNEALEREKNISKVKSNPEKKEREEKLKAEEEAAKSLLEEAKSKADNIKKLESKVADIPGLLEKEYNRGRKDEQAELEKKNKYEIELLKKDYQNTIDRQEDKINSLSSELNHVNELNSSLQDKMDKAYIQIKELATKTVEANGGVKILGNSPSDAK